MDEDVIAVNARMFIQTQIAWTLTH